MITPLLVVITLSIVDFASVFYASLALQNGVAQASRYGVTGTVAPTLSREDSIRAAFHAATPSLTVADNQIVFTHMRPGTANWLAGAGGPGDIARVSVTYSWQFLTPIARTFFPGGQISLRAESAMLSERSFN